MEKVFEVIGRSANAYDASFDEEWTARIPSLGRAVASVDDNRIVAVPFVFPQDGNAGYIKRCGIFCGCLTVAPVTINVSIRHRIVVERVIIQIEFGIALDGMGFAQLQECDISCRGKVKFRNAKLRFIRVIIIVRAVLDAHIFWCEGIFIFVL